MWLIWMLRGIFVLASVTCPTPANQHITAQQLYTWAQKQSLGTQELITALVIENSDEDFDDLCAAMAQAGPFSLDFTMSIERLLSIIEGQMAWALNDQQPEHWFWYVSANKLEPRLGQRHHEPGADCRASPNHCP